MVGLLLLFTCFIVSLTLGVRSCSGESSVVAHEFLLLPSHPMFGLK